MNRHGFTLIELSIVLVIIGLIIGSVLVGQDLIKAAEIRATISQIEKYNTAVNTFRVKYNGLPGDLRESDASALGFATRTGAPGHGDGDGMIESCAAPSYSTFGCESSLFWVDLSTAQLIVPSFRLAGDGLVSSATANQAAQYLPSAPLGKTSISVYSGFPNAYSFNSAFYYVLFQFTGTSPSGTYTSVNPSVTPLQASAIDQKIDDGSPLTGNVTAGYLADFGNWLYPIFPGAPCNVSNTYDTASSNATRAGCILTISRQ